MIVFVPEYDEATRANLLIANRLILPTDSIILVDNLATRRNFVETITANLKRPIFVMSHGSEEAIYCGLDLDNTALSQNELAGLVDTCIFVFACHTASSLGKKMATSRNVWWGYTGAIAAPGVADDEVQQIFANIFSYILNQFHRVEDVNQASNVIQRIKELCDEANYILDEHDGGLENLDARYCLIHLWDRLRIWFGRLVVPELLKHPAATSPILIP